MAVMICSADSIRQWSESYSCLYSLKSLFDQSDSKLACTHMLVKNSRITQMDTRWGEIFYLKVLG